MRALSISIALAGALAVTQNASADSYTGESYPASDLLAPCRTADSDARDGAPAETECEQYLIGYADALAEVGVAGTGRQICLPVENTADELRWAFVRWVYGDFTVRKAMPAADAVLATMKENFPCED